jgi:toluene monooxygenase system protein A
LFWKPNAGVSKAERVWLNEKYPGWDESWGVLWDQIIDNINEGKIERTYPETLPALCNVTQLPLGSAWNRFHLKQWKSEYKGRTYNFDSEMSKWCFDVEPERYAGHQNIIDRFLAGKIQPMNLQGGLAYMSITPDVMGDDAYSYRWAGEYRVSRVAR